MSTNPTNGDAKSKRRNFVNITLQVGKEGEGKYSQSGKPFASARGFYSQGKDKSTDEFLPSIWFKVMAFGKDGEDIAANPAVNILATAAKGDKIEVRGRLGLEEWTTNEGEKRSNLVIYATEVKPAETSDEQADEEPQP
jgi:single-stranded DNA-binding protein